MNSPLLTIVLTSCNYARHVPEAMRALAGQIGPDARLLIIDDGSTDNSPALIRERIAGNPHVTLLTNPGNTGIHAVLNQGLAAVDSPWILYSAMDDVAYPDLVGRLTALIRRYPHAGLCTAPADYLEAAGVRPRICRPQIIRPWIGPDLPDDAWHSPEAAADLMRRYGFWFAGMTTAFSVPALRDAGGFDATLGPLADSFVSQVVALRHGMATAARPLAGVRQATGGYSRAALDPDLAAMFRRNALARMESLPELFPREFREDWEAFDRIWALLRARKHGPERQGGLQLAFSAGLTGIKLWRNPLFRGRIGARLRQHWRRLFQKHGRP